MAPETRLVGPAERAATGPIASSPRTRGEHIHDERPTTPRPPPRSVPPTPEQRPSTRRKHRTSRPSVREVGARVLMRTVSVSGAGQGRANRCAVYLDRPCTADIVGSQCTAYRQRDGLHGQRGRRSPHRRTHTETAVRARGGLRPGRGADRLGVVVDWTEAAAKAGPQCKDVAGSSRGCLQLRGQRKDRAMSNKAHKNSEVCRFQRCASSSPASGFDSR